MGMIGMPEFKPEFDYTGNGEMPGAADGIHQVIGFEFREQYVDDKGNPFFQVDTNSGELKIGVRYFKSDDSTPPVSNLTVAEFWGLIYQFLGSYKDLKVSYSNRQQPATLVRAQEAVQKKRKTIQVEARNGGWVNPYPVIPVGIYTFKIKSIANPDHDNTFDFGKTQFGENLIFEMEIVGDNEGKSIPLNGLVIPLWMRNGFEILKEHWSYKKGQSGYYLSEAREWYHFVKHFASDFFENSAEYEWQTDPEESEYGVNEIEQPQYVLINKALEEDREVRLLVRNKEGKNAKPGVTTSFQSADQLESPEFEYVEEETSQEEESEWALQPLIDLMGTDCFEPSELAQQRLVFTEKGKLWVQTHLSDDEFLKEVGLERNTASLQNATAEQVAKIVERGSTAGESW